MLGGGGLVSVEMAQWTIPPTVHLSPQAVAFDVDSTVCAEEGIDVLADFLGQGKAVAELTAKYVGVVVCLY